LIYGSILGNAPINESSANPDVEKSNSKAVTPCEKEEHESIEVRNCCNLFSELFQRNNIEQIMALMKYSLELSSPWIPHYYKNDGEQEIMKNSMINKYMYKAWLIEDDVSLLNLFSKNENFDFLKEFG
jgi:hypothetical protein